MPVYETQVDRDAQQAIADILEEAWRCTIVMDRTPLARVDAKAFRDGSVVAVLEFKSRGKEGAKRFASFTSELIDVDKANALIETAMEYPNCRALFVSRYDDALIYVDVRQIGRCPILKPNGRKDRRSAADQHAAYEVPISLVHRVALPGQTSDQRSTRKATQAEKRTDERDDRIGSSHGERVAREAQIQAEIDDAEGRYDAMRETFATIDRNG